MAVNFPTLNAGTLTALPREVGGASVDRCVERLSSGLRINRAADDAAGLAVSENITARQRSRHRAIQNIHDGLSALQTADGGMNEIGDMLVRIRELALQAASGQYSDEQRGYMQDEVMSLTAAIDQVTTSCEFNGRYLLRGPVVDVVFLVDTSGSMGGEIAQVRASLADFRDTFGSAGVSVRFGLMGSEDAGDHAVLLADVGDQDFVSVLNSVIVTGHGQDPYSMLYNASGLNDTPGTYEPDAMNYRPGATRHFIHLTDAGREVATPGIDPSETNLAQALAAAEITVDFICRPGSAPIFDEIAATTGGAVQSLGNGAGSNVPNALDNIAQRVSDALQSTAESIVIQAGVSQQERIDVALPSDLSANTLGILGVDLTTQETAQQALPVISDALDQLNAARSAVAASANALTHRLDVQQRGVEGDAATNSRIRDADIAHEATELTRQKILAQGEVALQSQVKQLNRAVVETLLNKSG
jgi:flagellin